VYLYPTGTGCPVIPPGTGFPSRRLLLLAGLTRLIRGKQRFQCFHFVNMQSELLVLNGYERKMATVNLSDRYAVIILYIYFCFSSYVSILNKYRNVAYGVTDALQKSVFLVILSVL
jgi:hypothetical protein